MMKIQKIRLLIRVIHSGIYILAIEILGSKEISSTFENTIRNYVLKMKVRNKLGLTLSRWVGYIEIK
jgi:hypothetical protein